MNKPMVNEAEPSSLESFSNELLSQSASVRAGYEERSVIVQAVRLVKTMRLDAGMTQRDLAARLHTSYQTIVRLEASTGKQGPRVEELARVAAACNVHLVLGYIDHSIEADEPRTVKWIS